MATQPQFDSLVKKVSPALFVMLGLLWLFQEGTIEAAIATVAALVNLFAHWNRNEQVDRFLGFGLIGLVLIAVGVLGTLVYLRSARGVPLIGGLPSGTTPSAVPTQGLATMQTANTLTSTPFLTSTPEVKLVTVEATSFPFQPTGINIGSGDTLEFVVDGGFNAIWQCAGGLYLSADGQADIERQKSVFYVPANFCSLVGYIEGNQQGRQYFQIGVSKNILVEISGMLYLGVNDSPPEKCALEDKQECYRDNDGELTVKITVIRGN